MRYRVHVDIRAPRAQVVQWVTDRERFPHWQQGFLAAEPLSGEPFAPGATCRLKFRMGKSVCEMNETIQENQLPESYVATYEAGKVWNRVRNHFSELEAGTTRWTLESEFRFGGFMRLVAFFFPRVFRKQSLKFMHHFKAYIEEDKRVT